MALQVSEVNVAVAPKSNVTRFVKELRRRQGLDEHKQPKRPGYDLTTTARRLAYAMKDYAADPTLRTYNTLTLTLGYARNWYGDEAAAQMWRDAKRRFTLTIDTPRAITQAWLPVNTKPDAPFAEWSVLDEQRMTWADPCHDGADEDAYDGTDGLADYAEWDEFGSAHDAGWGEIAYHLETLRLAIGGLQKRIKAADLANTPHLFGTPDRTGRLVYSAEEFAAMRAPSLLRDKLQRQIAQLAAYGKRTRELVMDNLNPPLNVDVRPLLDEEARFIYALTSERVDLDLEPQKEEGRQAKQIVGDISLSSYVAHEDQDDDAAHSWRPSARDYTLRYLGMPRTGLISNLQRDINAHDETTLVYRAMAMDLETFFAFFRARPSRTGQTTGCLPFSISDVTSLRPVGLEDHLKAFALCIWSDELTGRDDAGTYFQHFAQLCDSAEMASNVKEAVYAANLEPRPNDAFLLACYHQGR